MIQIITIIIAFISLLSSIYQYFVNTRRARKEATLIAYKKLQVDGISKIIEYEEIIPEMKRTDKEWNSLTTAMANIENFCVGINTGIYDIKVLNRLGGAFFMRLYEKLKPIIMIKRNDDITSKHYDEFEETVKRLEKIRKRSMNKK